MIGQVAMDEHGNETHAAHGNCGMNDWVSLSYKGYNPDGKLEFDSS